MSDTPTLPPTPGKFKPRPPRKPFFAGRSSGLKLIIVCALVLLMSIPAMFISYISYERSSRADDVTREVSQDYGGAATGHGATHRRAIRQTQ
ncbi:inner membrane CreD family protein [Litorimonas sp. RW-G-Af-16]|uniref:inner membrane CreD family protein n=1 Tax=Litorimonas sp. RW-G-Af-16 TaxID=3241168 RepID=UPI003AAB048E